MDLRRSIVRDRAELAGAARRRAEERAHAVVRTHEAFLAAETVAGYLAMPGEFDVVGLLHAAHAAGKRCFVPVLAGPRLVFRRWSPKAALAANRFGIPEPTTGEVIDALALALVLVPLVAFDRAGRRMGMGGGFYDRTFAPVCEARRAGAPRPTLVGAAYELQRVGALAANPWDVPLDAVATEDGWHDCEEDPCATG